MEDIDLILDDITEGSNYIVDLKALKPDQMKSFKKGKTPGETTHIKKLDDNLTMRPGFLYGVTGWPGSGKSEFVTQLSVLQVVFSKRKVAIYSPESYPVDEFIDTIIHCYLGKTTDKRYPNFCTEEEYSTAYDWVTENFYILDWSDIPSPDNVLAAFNFLVKKKVGFFVIDPYNSLNDEEQNPNLALELKKNLSKFKHFAKATRSILLIIEHPKTPGDIKEFDACPGARNMFGGTMWWNKVDCLFAVHRPNRHDKTDKTVLVVVWKMKNQPLNGIPGEVVLYFDVKRKRYYQDEACTIHRMDKSPEEIELIDYSQPEF